MSDTRTLAEQLAHCDGADCTCMAHNEGECACDADWTPAEVYRLRAAERDKWQPIETAPHDRCVLLCCGDGRLWVGGWAQNPWDGDEAFVIADLDDGSRAVVHPTHWRELPEAPND